MARIVNSNGSRKAVAQSCAWPSWAGGYALVKKSNIPEWVYILIAKDTENIRGKIIPAKIVVEHRLNNACWPIYDSTNHRTKLAPGDMILAYVGGISTNAQTFMASATIKSIVQGNSTFVKINKDIELYESNQYLILEKIERFDPPISIRPLLDKLSFIPINKQKWGVALMGGCRIISRNDCNIIITK